MSWIVGLMLVWGGIVYAADNGLPPSSAATPSTPNWLDPAFPTSSTEHLRLDEAEIAKYGDGSFDKGLNALGAAGFRLFGVTTAGDQGKSGWHIFKRQGWNAPVPRPRVEYKRVDSSSIEQLGDGKFAPGMQKIEQDHWELVAYTTDKAGQIGWFYFERPFPPPAR
jgi:hypothetical protein